MTRRGRRPTGANLVNGLEGSEQAKIRLKTILQTMTGELSIPEACGTLGICETRIHDLRWQVLQTALDCLEPRLVGRPPRVPNPLDFRLAELEGENRQLQVELKASEIRRELAENLPRVVPQAQEPEKKTKVQAKKRLRRYRKILRESQKPENP
jgi:hypothetical protein